jgi:hypothetical protein
VGPAIFQSRDTGVEINELVRTWGDELKDMSDIQSGRRGIAKEFKANDSRVGLIVSRTTSVGGRSQVKRPAGFDGPSGTMIQKSYESNDSVSLSKVY